MKCFSVTWQAQKQKQLNKIRMAFVIQMDQMTAPFEQYSPPGNSYEDEDEPRPNTMLVFAKNNFDMLQSRTEELKTERAFYKTKTK